MNIGFALCYKTAVKFVLSTKYQAEFLTHTKYLTLDDLLRDALGALRKSFEFHT